MRVAIETKKCPYCNGEIKSGTTVCNCCSMDLSIFRTNKDNQLVKVCPSCSREYSFATKVCNFCARYLDVKSAPLIETKYEHKVGSSLLNALVIPGLGSLLAGRKKEAICYFIMYFLWITAAIILTIKTAGWFLALVIPVEVTLRTLNLFIILNPKN